MAMNPMKLLKLKDRYKLFKADHPKLVAFGGVAAGTVKAGSQVKIMITNDDGKSIGTEFELTANDIQTLEMLKDLRK